MRLAGARFRLYFFIVLLLIVSVICLCINHEVDKDYTEEETKGEELDIKNDDIIEVKKVEAKKEGTKVEKVQSVDTTSKDWSSEDSYLLAKIAMAEAEGEDIEGKALVILVVLNRVFDKEFPSTIGDVIYQDQQFSPIKNGRFNRVEPNQECYEALKLVIKGWNESQGALFFTSSKEADNWHNNTLTKLYSHGNHIFYK